MKERRGGASSRFGQSSSRSSSRLRRDGRVGSAAQAAVDRSERRRLDADARSLFPFRRKTRRGLGVPLVVRRREREGPSRATLRRSLAAVRPAEGAKCPRCWQVRTDVEPERDLRALPPRRRRVESGRAAPARLFRNLARRRGPGPGHEGDRGRADPASRHDPGHPRLLRPDAREEQGHRVRPLRVHRLARAHGDPHARGGRGLPRRPRVVAHLARRRSRACRPLSPSSWAGPSGTSSTAFAFSR